jgi:hypothetical protein
MCDNGWEFVGLRPLLKCKLFLINMLTFRAKMSFSRRSTSWVLSPTGC